MSIRIRACALDALDFPPDFNLKVVSNSLTRLHKEEVKEDGGSKMVRSILVIVAPSP